MIEAADAGSAPAAAWPHGDVPRLTTPTGSWTVVPAAKVALGATASAPSSSPVTRTTTVRRSACDAASKATPSPSWSVMVSR